MWPVHCVQGTKGAEFHEKCPVQDGEVIVDKGTDKTVDSYSGFGTPPEKTILLDELVMGATLQDLTSLEHDDFISILDGRESMSDDDNCLTELAIGKDAI